MADRCALLKSMKKSVDERGVIQKQYTDGERCCVVGYALTELGMTANDLEKLRGASIVNIYEQTRTLSYNIPCDIWNEAHTLVRASGISQDEWGALQDTNDRNDQTAVTDRLNKMLDESNC